MSFSGRKALVRKLNSYFAGAGAAVSKTSQDDPVSAASDAAAARWSAAVLATHPTVASVPFTVSHPDGGPDE
jgi:hypothetical protein